MYYIARFISFLILFAIFLLILKLLKFRIIKKDKNPEFFEKFANDKKFRRKQRIIYIFVALTFVAIIFISRYPFEGYFITFNTIEDSLSYKGISTEDITIYESDTTVFVTPKKNNNVYTIAKIGDKYKLAEFQSKNIKYYEPHSVGDYVQYCTVEYNKETNETFYYVRVRSVQDLYVDEIALYEEVTIDDKKMEFGISDFSLYDYQLDNKDNLVFYYIDNEPPKNSYELSLLADTFEYTTLVVREFP